jgi:hypothetical protein
VTAVDQRALRVAEAVRSAGADWAVLTAPASVSYATGHDLSRIHL